MRSGETVRGGTDVVGANNVIAPSTEWTLQSLRHFCLKRFGAER